MLKDKYCSIAEKDLIENKDKIAITTDNYVIAEMLEKLMIKLENLRLSLI